MNPNERLTVIEWTVRLGAITADALAARRGMSTPSARATLNAAVRSGLLRSNAPLARQPALYTVTRKGARACGALELSPCRVSPSGARHLIVVAAVAAVLERRFPTHTLAGERELRRDEHRLRAPLASATLGHDECGGKLLHRPDLVLWPKTTRRRGGGRDGSPQRPIAVEVELTVKAGARLEAICGAWGRCELVVGVLYVITPTVRVPLERAVAQAGAGERIAMIEAADLLGDRRDSPIS